MGLSESKILSLVGKILIVTFFIFFPFGQLLRIERDFSFGKVVIQPIDIIAFFSLFFLISNHFKIPKIFKFIRNFLLVSLFSLILSFNYFSLKEIIIGSLYLIRLSGYISFFLLSWNLVKGSDNKNTIFSLGIISIIIVGILGWLQYLFFPDLRSLKYVGWDDHLFRLVGTFLDPGYTAIILVIGFLMVFAKILQKKNKLLIPALIFFLITIAFTYSRASYLALVTGILASIIIFKIKLRYFIPALVLFLLVLSFLPRPSSEGVKLERLNSVFAKFTNYNETLEVIKKYPLFGVGFNNLCSARIRLFKSESYISHSCSGSDSSFLFVAATTGIVGFILFMTISIKIFKNLIKDFYGKSFLILSLSVLINSFFINSLFYPWILGLMSILLGISIGSKKIQRL